MKKKIIVSKTAGFCMGVKRAVDMTLDLVDKSTHSASSGLKEPVYPHTKIENFGVGIYTYGALIHNPQVTELLAKKGIVVIKDDRIPEKGTIVVRTHGISPSVSRKINTAKVKILDATCPFVKKVQKIIDEYKNKGFGIIIIGDKGHAEVESYLGYAGSSGCVVSSEDEIESNIKKNMKMCVVAQTTMDREKFERIIKKLEGSNMDLKVFDTICNATSKRQEEALEMSKKVDAMIVVGGRDSANTQRLAEICRTAGAKVYQIERPDELDISEISKYKTIGITAGASTSKDTIKEVVDYLNEKTKSS